MTTEADLKKIVGQRLQMLRLEKCLTQEQMGEKLNLSTSAYCKIEYGETDLTLTRLNKIAEVLNMSAVELFSKIDGKQIWDSYVDLWENGRKTMSYAEWKIELSRITSKMNNFIYQVSKHNLRIGKFYEQMGNITCLEENDT